MCYIDLEPCTVWDENTVRARKIHRCDCCGGDILIGRRYTRHFSVFDRSPTSEKMCAACTKMSLAFSDEHGQRANPSAMRELLDECIGWGRESRGAEAKPWRLAVLGMQRRYRRRQARLSRLWCPKRPRRGSTRRQQGPRGVAHA